jgi:hypothetical protein
VLSLVLLAAACLATRKAEGKVASFVPLWIQNAIEVEATASVIE